MCKTDEANMFLKPPFICAYYNYYVILHITSLQSQKKKNIYIKINLRTRYYCDHFDLFLDVRNNKEVCNVQ